MGSKAGVIWMVFANFITWTEEDPNNKLTQTIPRATWTNMVRNEACYLYKEVTTPSEFTHYLTFQLSSIDVNADASTNFLACIWLVCENAGRAFHIEIGKSINLSVIEKGSSTTQYQLYLSHADDVVQDWSVDLDVGTTYYLKIVKSGAVVTCTIYSDAAQTVTVDTLIIDLTGEDEEDMSFSYMETTASYPFAGDDSDQSDGWVGMWLISSGGSGGDSGQIVNEGGSVDFDIVKLVEKETCDVAVRPVPLRGAGPKVDTEHYQPHLRVLQLTLIVTGANKTTLGSIIASGSKVGVTLVNNWYYYGWLTQKDIRWKYHKIDGEVKEWITELEIDVEFMSWYA